jgi:single-strand DNA-binding protein
LKPGSGSIRGPFYWFVSGRRPARDAQRGVLRVATDNQVTLVGNLTDDPELRFTPNGAAVANFRLAVTPRVRDGDNWKDGETSFFRVNVWRQMAENVAESMTKGTRAIVVGRLRTRSWETPEGEKRSVTEIEADEVAPSLKFATAKVERASRGGGGGGGDWAGNSAGASRSSGQFNDEPPF